jgi:hypothetical protein
MSGDWNDLRQSSLAATLKLLSYCQSHEWAGIDPYDALNSRVFNAAPALNHRLPRLVITQALKRLPFNIRPLLLIPSTQNPKALGLFLSSILKLTETGLIADDKAVSYLTGRLENLRSAGTAYWCWGYSFPWQTRTVVVPRGRPNLVCTTFVADALLDAYERSGNARYLEIAASSAQYILDELYWLNGGTVGFAYPLPSMRQPIHNANLLGAALLCRVARHTGNTALIEPALKVARYSVSRQREDGSWLYGEASTQGWIDNFHTGYNLCALRSLARELDTAEFDVPIRRGYTFYCEHFFREDGASRYFHDCTYPIDIHCVAQSLITLLAFRNADPTALRTAAEVFHWTMAQMWDDRGFFFYRVLRFCTIRTSYMRWSQAWMLLALSTLVATLAPETGLTLPVPLDASSVSL